MFLFIYLISQIILLLAAAPVDNPNYVWFDLEEIRGTNSSHISKRGLAETPFTDHYSYYTAKVQVGSNKQAVNLLLDTGSSDMYVWDSTKCASSKCTLGTYTHSKSTTYKGLSKLFSETYGSGKATGYWGADSVTFGGATIKNHQFAVATSSPSTFGVFGIGLSPNVIGNTPSYSNFPKRLRTDGFIKKTAFSFFAGAHGKNNGHILFGAVDMAKVSGKLYKVPFVKTQSSYKVPHTPTVKVAGITLESKYSSIKGKTLTSTAHNFLIDTGTSYTLLPSDAFKSLVSSLKATSSGGAYYVDCGLMNKNIDLNFNFSQVKIKVPLSDLVYQESATKCLLGVAQGSSLYIFGANAIRSSYLTFDYDNYLVYMGAANTAATTQNIKVITSTIPTS